MNSAGECAVNGIEGRFPDEGEFVEDIGDYVCVHFVVHEDDDSGRADDHAAQCWPVIESRRILGGLEDEGEETRIFDGGGVIADRVVESVSD